VVFTGGEPFLYADELREILEATRDTGLPFRIVTAAHWAKDSDTAHRLLSPLVAAGLDELSLSTDPSHQQFVPARFVETALEVALDLGLRCEVAGVFWRPGLRLQHMIRLPANRPVGIVERLVVPTGRAAQARITPETYGLQHAQRFGPCQDPGQYDVTIYPDGHVYPCCSGGFNQRARLSYGTIGQDSLATILSRMHTDRYLHVVMHEGGLELLYQLAAWKWSQVVPLLPDRTSLVSVCQLCERIHGNPELLDAVAPVVAYAHRLVTVLSGADPQPKDRETQARALPTHRTDAPSA
jgi:MoaA/NifB/PqqE/SkfB family radical SAM enzyme